MSKEASAIIAEKLTTKSALASAFEAKPYYKNFTLYFISIILVSCLALSAALSLLLYQSNQTQALIHQQLKPLNNKLLQQFYLLKATKVINEVLTHFNLQQLADLHQEVISQQKQLLLFNSAHRSDYQQWYSDNDAQSELVTRITENYKKNEQLRVKTVTQVESLLNNISIELSKNTPAKQQLLLHAQQQLTEVLLSLQQFGVNSSLDDFENLRISIENIILMDFPKKLASWQQANANSVDIVRGFIQLEDIVLNLGLLTQWQVQLSLSNNYKNRLSAQQVKMKSVMEKLANVNATKLPNNESSLVDVETLLAQNKSPRWLFIAFALVITIIVAVVLMLWLRIKHSSKMNTTLINEALEATCAVAEAGVSAKASKTKSTLYSEETYLLINKIQQINNSRYSEHEYSTLAQKKQKIENQQRAALDKIEQLKVALTEAEYKAKSSFNSQLLVEQDQCKRLNNSAVRQLQLIGASALSRTKPITSTHHINHKAHYLFRAFEEVKDLLLSLRQANFNSYLQTDDAVLTLNDVDIIAILQAQLLNLSNQLFVCHNHISVIIDEKIQAKVNVDAELVAEMLGVFIRLILLEQRNCHLTLSVQLVAKKDGKQVLVFTGEIASEKSVVQLPNVLQDFEEENEAKNELTGYFRALLAYQYGDNIKARHTKKGYRLSFTLPLALSGTNSQQNYAKMSLPQCLPDIASLVNNLASHYLPMPIEVLLAVKSPIEYQGIQQIIQAMGLQVTLVVNETMLTSCWQSGRFAVLITEIAYMPFIDFHVKELTNTEGEKAIPRGVFSLDIVSTMQPCPGEFSHWIVGQLSREISIEALVTAMKPWLNEKVSTRSHANEVVQEQLLANKKKPADENTFAAEFFPENANIESFNFQRYILNQGSIELAIYMLEEYIQENSQLMADLSVAFNDNQRDLVLTIINKLTVNGRILAANHLLRLCDDWHQFINAVGIDNSLQSQIALLNKTENAVEAINAYADTVV